MLLRVGGHEGTNKQDSLMTQVHNEADLDRIVCPRCGEPIPVTAALQRQIAERLRKELQQELVEQEQALAAKRQGLEEKEASLAEAETDFNKRVHERVEQEKAKLEHEAREAAKQELTLEMEDLRTRLREQEEKLGEARTQELELRKRERALEEGNKELQLEVGRRINAERAAIEEQAAKRIAEEHRLKDLEKEKQIGDLRRQIDDLKRKAEQGSQQLQGEVLELDLESLLRENFPFDSVDPVPKGIAGADIVQRVFTRTGVCCGSIVWESKRTKTWSNSWIQKLKDDQRDVKGDLAVLVSEALPNDVTDFRLRDGVWVASFDSTLALAAVLREWLANVARTKMAVEGKDEKLELLFSYLTGPQFRQRVEAILETFKAMKEDLDDEKRTTARRWAKREKHIDKVIGNTAGMYGDLQGLVGTSLQTIPALEEGRVDDEFTNEAGAEHQP
jgi:hypothetical protein